VITSAFLPPRKHPDAVIEKINTMKTAEILMNPPNDKN
jgi:hypothetical protein